MDPSASYEGLVAIVRDWRRSQRLSLRAAAERLGVSYSALSRFESSVAEHQTRPSALRLRQIVDAIYPDLKGFDRVRAVELVEELSGLPRGSTVPLVGES